jgi:hypothetical protein
MSPALTTTLIVTLAALLAVASGLAGALWWRDRRAPRVDAAKLAETLSARLKTLDALIERLDLAAERLAVTAKPQPSPRRASAPGAVAKRVDPPQPDAVVGPTLISVPDLAAMPSPSASAELGRRFGAIWDMADAGERPDEIAHRTGQPIGQVELILGLRRQLANGGRT